MPQAKNKKSAAKGSKKASEAAKVEQEQEPQAQVVVQDEEEEPSEIDSFVLDEHEEETGELSEDSRLDDEDLEEDSEDEDEDLDDDDEDEDDEDLDDLDGVDPNQRFLLRGVAGAAAVAKDDLDVVGVDPVSGSEIYPPVDPETQAKLEALFETAGIGKLAGETKQFTDPEVLKRLTSSVSCALDEAAAALTRMRSDPPTDGKTLVDACNEGDFSKVRKLLDEGRVSVHDTTEEGESLLSLACSAGYYELAQVLLAMRANVEDRGMKGDCTPLMEAASSGHLEIVKLLISHGADVNSQSSSGNTPLMYACASGHSEIVRVLLEANANVEDHNENGHTPLMEAASAGHVEVAKILLEYGAGINTHSNEFKESALTLACYKGHLEMVRFLLEAGADQEHKTDEMHTALMEASMDGHVEVARLLLDSGAQVNMPADSFESPLTLAACGGHVELAMLLLERGANIEEVNDEGYTPLMEAAREGHEEMVALLLSQGADINAQTEETQETALTLACCGGFLDVADFLIKAGADIELGASTPLMEAAQEGHLELVKYLLEARADVNAQTGDSALSFACERGHTDVADLLLKWGADLEHESEGGRTPLMKAVRAGHYCTAKFLIGKGANVNKATANNDHTPLSLACAGGHLAIVELLLQNKADPYHKLKDNSTMLIEAAKGGHTTVVSVLIDYNPGNLSGSEEGGVAVEGGVASEAITEVVSDTELIPTRFPAEGHEQASSATQPAPPAVSSLPNKSNSALKSVLRKTRSSNAPSSPKDSKASKSEAGYDFIEGSGFVIEGLEDKGLDAKSYIQQMLRRTDASSREEQIIQKEQILAQLQRVERELQEKAHAQMMLNNDSTDQIRATEMLEDMVHLSLNNVAAAAAAASASTSGNNNSGGGGNSSSSTNSASSTASTVSSATSASATPAPPPPAPPTTTGVSSSSSTSSSSVRNVTNLANLPPSERPKAKPSRKIVNNQQNNNAGGNSNNVVTDKSKKCQLQAALQQHSQQLAQLQQLQQLNQQLQQQVLQQRQLKQQNQATLAALQQNAIANQQQLAALQHNVAQLQSLEQHILAQQTSSQNQQHQLQQRVQQILQQKQQLQHQIKQFQQQVEQQLAYTQHATPSNTPPPSTSSSSSSSSTSSTTTSSSTNTSDKPQSKTNATKRANNDSQSSSSSSSTSSSSSSTAKTKQPPTASEATVAAAAAILPTTAAAAYELVQASQALQAVQALQHLDPSANAGGSNVDADIEPLTQDPTLLLTAMAGQVGQPNPLTEAIHLQLPLEAHQGLPYAYKEGFQASPDLARTIQAGAVQYSALQVSQAECGGQQGSQQQSVTALGHQLLLQSQFPFGQHVDANGQINFAGADMAGSSYLPGEAVFLQGTMAASEAAAAFSQPDLPPAGVTTVQDPKKATGKAAGGKTSGKKAKHNNNGQQQPQQPPQVVQPPAASVVAPVQPVLPPVQPVVQPDVQVGGAGDNPDILQFQSVVGPQSVVDSAAAAAMETYEAYTAAVASAAVDLDSETDSNHDTALTLACAGGHEELVTLLINRGANIEHRDKKGFTPLILAATAGHDKVCEILLDHNADIEAQSERTKDTPLSLACSGGRYEVVEVLLRRNANKEHRNVSDYTPLALAASGGYVNIIKLLLAHGAEINSRTGSKLGISPLMLAAMNGHTASVKLLLDMGSDINAQIETNRNTALTLACFQGRHEVVSLLLDRKANVEHRAKTGLTPLMEAASGGFVDVGRVLLDKGADVNAPPVPSSRDTALTIAADKGHYRFVELLLSRGAQVDVRNKKGNSSLWLAANGGHLDVVQLLHSAGADIDSQDNRKVSCLMAAFRKGHSKVVKWMVKHVSQFPSDTELTRYIATISDKDLLKKCHTCMEIIRVAKERQAAEAAKNASNLLEELDREKNLEESKKAAAARKREKKKRKKMEKLQEKGLLEPDQDLDNKENENDTEDEKEKSPEINNDRLDLHSQASSSEQDLSMSSTSKQSVAKIELKSEESDANANKADQRKTSKKTKNKKKVKSPTDNDDKEESPPPPVQAVVKKEPAKRQEQRVPVPVEPPVLPMTNGDSPPMIVTTKKRNRRSTEEAKVSEIVKTNISPNNAAGKKKTGTPAVQTGTPDAGWKEVVRKSKKVIVPANAISRVIGRGGCNINAIREMSGAHIEVEKLQGKASATQQTERTILIKGSAEATRQANNWIQQIINSPDKDMADILGKSYLAKLPITSTTPLVQSAVILNSNAKILNTTTVNSLASVIATSSVAPQGPAKKVNAVQAASGVKPFVAKAQQSTSFAAVASGSSNDSFGMIQTGGTHPGTLAKAGSRKAKTPDLPNASAQVAPQAPQPLLQDANLDFGSIGTFEKSEVKVQQAAANLDSKDYSPFKSYTGWGSNNSNDNEVTDKNFAAIAAAGIDGVDLAAKAPGYRISPSGGPLIGNRPVTSSSVMTSSYGQERSNSAPGSPIMPSPIGPPVVGGQPNKLASTTSPGSEPDQYRTGSSLSSGIGLSPGSGTGFSSGTGLSNHIAGNRSTTPDSDSMRTTTNRSGSMSMAPEKSDPFGVRPASLGSANSSTNPQPGTNPNFVVNPENLLSAAAQMASAFAASDMDYLSGSSRVGQSNFNDFNARFNGPVGQPPGGIGQPPPGVPPTSSAFMPPTTKLNPNAPDFMRPSSSQDYRMRNQQNLLNKNNFNSSANYNRFNNSNNLPNILTNQGINAYLQSQSQAMNNSGASSGPSTGIDLSAFDTNILSGRSIKEINELIAGTASSALQPSFQQHQQPPPPPPHAPPPVQQPQQQQQQGFNYFNEPKFNAAGLNSSRPIGSERSRLEPMMKPPSNSPWDLSTLYDTIGSSNNDFGGFLGSSQTLQQTLDAFNGFSSQTSQPPPPPPQQQQQPPPVGGPPNADYMSNLTSPVMGMTPNVTPSKSDYGDYLPNMMSAGNNPGSSGKKMGYLDQQPMGLAGRGDPASVRRNINQSWNKKWGDD